MSDSFQASLGSAIDCDALVSGSDNETQSTSVKSSKHNFSGHTQQINLAVLSSDFKLQSVVNSQI